jgi:hypothetical protein
MLALDHGIDVTRRQDPGEYLRGNRCILSTDFLVENKGRRPILASRQRRSTEQGERLGSSRAGGVCRTAIRAVRK